MSETGGAVEGPVLMLMRYLELPLELQPVKKRCQIECQNM